MSFQPYLAKNPWGDVPVDFGKSRFDFIDETEDGGIDKALHPGMTFGPWLFNFNQTPSTPIGNATVVGTISNGNTAVFVCPAHGLANGVAVRLETDGIMPSGFSNNTYYYTVQHDVDSTKLALTINGTPLPYIDSGTGNLVIFKRGLPYNFIGWSVNAWVKNNTSDADADIIWDLAPTFSTVPGQVIISAGQETKDLLDAKAYWDMVFEDPEGELFNVFVANRFDITKTVTHPFV